MDQSTKAKFTQQFWASLSRMVFYYAVIYGSLLCGSATVTKIFLFTPRCLWIAALFLPFVFVYSMLFELAEFEFYKRPPMDRSDYHQANYAYLIWTALATLLPFLAAFYVCTTRNYVPVGYYPYLVIFHFALTGYLFASKYRLLQLQRRQDEIADDDSGPHSTTQAEQAEVGSQVVRSLVALKPIWITLIIIGAVVFAVQGIGLRSADDAFRQELSRACISTFVILILWALTVFLSERLSKNKNIQDRFSFERPIVRETVLLASIFWIPFFSGIHTSYALYIKTELWAAIGTFVTSVRHMSVLVIVSGVYLA